MTTATENAVPLDDREIAVIHEFAGLEISGLGDRIRHLDESTDDADVFVAYGLRVVALGELLRMVRNRCLEPTEVALSGMRLGVTVFEDLIRDGGDEEGDEQLLEDRRKLAVCRDLLARCGGAPTQETGGDA